MTTTMRSRPRTACAGQDRPRSRCRPRPLRPRHQARLLARANARPRVVCAAGVLPRTVPGRCDHLRRLGVPARPLVVTVGGITWRGLVRLIVASAPRRAVPRRVDRRVAVVVTSAPRWTAVDRLVHRALVARIGWRRRSPCHPRGGPRAGGIAPSVARATAAAPWLPVRSCRASRRGSPPSASAGQHASGTSSGRSRPMFTFFSIDQPDQRRPCASAVAASTTCCTRSMFEARR